MRVNLVAGYVAVFINRASATSILKAHVARPLRARKHTKD